MELDSFYKLSDEQVKMLINEVSLYNLLKILATHYGDRRFRKRIFKFLSKQAPVVVRSVRKKLGLITFQLFLESSESDFLEAVECVISNRDSHNRRRAPLHR